MKLEIKLFLYWSNIEERICKDDDEDYIILSMFLETFDCSRCCELKEKGTSSQLFAFIHSGKKLGKVADTSRLLILSEIIMESWLVLMYHFVEQELSGIFLSANEKNAVKMNIYFFCKSFWSRQVTNVRGLVILSIWHPDFRHGG